MTEVAPAGMKRSRPATGKMGSKNFPKNIGVAIRENLRGPWNHLQHQGHSSGARGFGVLGPSRAPELSSAPRTLVLVELKRDGRQLSKCDGMGKNQADHRDRVAECGKWLARHQTYDKKGSKTYNNCAMIVQTAGGDDRTQLGGHARAAVREGNC